MNDTASVTSTTLDRFIELERTLNGDLIEREKEVHAIITAVAAGAHFFLLGPPGVAKSMTIDRLAGHIEGANYFSILMTKFSTLDELLGPVSLRGLEEDRYERLLEGYLAWAHFGFLDEAWKSSSAALNSLLWAANERKVRNGPEIIDIPLSSLGLASNELPESDALNAIYDRIEVRLVVDPIRDPGNQRRLLKTGGKFEAPKPVLSWSDVEDMKKIVRNVEVPDLVLDKMIELRRNMREANIEPTDRRWARSIPLLQAEAALDGCEQIEVEHLAFLTNTLWDRPEQIGDVESIVLGMANPIQKRALDMLTAIEQLSSEVEAITSGSDDKDPTGPAMEIQRKIKKANKELEKIESEVGQSRRQQETVSSCRTRLYAVTVRLLKDVFDLTDDAIAKMVDKNA